MERSASATATDSGVREPDDLAAGPTPGDARAIVATRDLSLRLALRFVALSACAAGIAFLELGDDVSVLAKGLAFVFLVLALHFMTSPDP